jgi:putative membrane-bound dehydrogenase-like protein
MALCRVRDGLGDSSMKHLWLPSLVLGVCTVALVLPAGEKARTGPQTEKRFPPLKLPPGFKATLFACDPLIEYPSVIAAGPRPNQLFVAVDYVTGLGIDIVRRDEIRLIEDTDGDGYADRATVFAKGFNSIQGLAYHDGTVYVMHAPFLTALRDTKGTGVADERRDLLTGLGLTPEKNPTRLHCANGVIVGHDGWLYLAMGDNGLDVLRPEGDRLVLHSGGILRCRPDGRDLHVFATGLRNIYDVALDAELNAFVRDNENDGGTYMIRVCHSFHGADHGYPYLYDERPEEALPPLADLGLGSSAGGVCYLEPHFPPEYRGDLFFCEWGRSVVRYQPRRSGSAFAPLKEIVFASGAADDPYGFHPTDLVVQRDGALMISDWADGQRPRRGRGRIYRVTSAAETPVRGASQNRPDPVAQLDSPSYYERCDSQCALERRGADCLKPLRTALAEGRPGVHGRLHAIWALAHVAGPAAIDDLLRVAKGDSEPTVRAQAIRAIADLADPILIRHKLDAGGGDEDLARRLTAMAKGQDRRVLLEIIVTLGRLRWAGSPAWLAQNLVDPDAPLAHAAMQTLRRSANWPAVLTLLDQPTAAPLWPIAVRAVAEQFDSGLVDGVIARLAREPDATRRLKYADLLTRVYKKPGAWTYWGYRPAPRPANTVAWERTDAIGEALDRALSDADRTVRLAVLKRMQREKVPARLVTLGPWLREELQPERAAALLLAMRDQPVSEARAYLEPVVRDPRHSDANRLAALGVLVQEIDAASARQLLALAQALEEGPVQAAALRQVARFPKLDAGAFLARCVKSANAEVRAAAIEALGELQDSEGREPVLALLNDRDVRVRRAAARAAGRLQAKASVETLERLMTDSDADVRRGSLDSLRRLGPPRAVPLAVAALADRHLEIVALECLGELGGPAQTAAVVDFARHNPSAAVPAAAVRVLTGWRDRQGVTGAERAALDSAVAELHGEHGILVRWRAAGPLTSQAAQKAIDRLAITGPPRDADWRTLFATGTEARAALATKGGKDDRWLAYTEATVAEATAVEFLASSSGTLRVLLNGNDIYRRADPRSFQIDSDRFAATLAKGVNRLLVEVGPGKTAVDFHLRFRRKSSKADHERLTQAALTRAGNPERGRKLFLDIDKSQCLKCHRLADQGERIGPELTGVGSRFSRIYLIESILEPSRTIAPSYGSLVVSLTNGKVLTGVKVAEDNGTLTLADNQGQKHVLTKAEIDTQQPSAVSTMPEGLEKRFTEAEFVDLIAFLTSQKGPG